MDADPPVTQHAPGAPGIGPTWTSSDKDTVGCTLGPARLWFTLGHGILNEVYYPRVDIPQIRDLGFIVAGGTGFWVEVKRLETREVRLAGEGIPAVEVVHRHPQFELGLRITPDRRRDVLLVEVVLEGDADLRPYVLLAPHLGGTGRDNTAAVDGFRGRRVLWAEQGPFALALVAADEHQRDAWERASAGYVGESDGWQDFARNGAMQWEYLRAGPGNVALMGSLPRRAVLALGFGSSRESAATLAISSLLRPFERAWQRQLVDWKSWHEKCSNHRALTMELPESVRHAFTVSAMALRVHQDKTYPGAMVASLSVPWGNTRDELGGYHLVWPRDLVECAGALLGLGAEEEARDSLRYLIATQHEDGHWYQNQWLGGKPYWEGVQLDEAGFSVLLAAALAERDALAGIEVEDMVRRALGFIARVGPSSDQDRWEEVAGVNTFTLAVCIAALVAGARFLDPEASAFSLALADYWNASIEDWTAARDTPLARRLAVRGYYVRVAPLQGIGDAEYQSHVRPIEDCATDPRPPVDGQVGVDFLQLVRFGLRRPDHPMVRDSLTVVDALLRVDFPGGPAWRRYNGDGYGEHEDGRPFDGSGRGRAWPLLTGERGHYELVAGNDPLPYLEAMAAMSGASGMLPEQVWDGDPIAARGLFPGRPSGSAMPLAWAHGELVKLVLSRELGRPFDRPEAVWARYRGRRPRSAKAFWSAQAPVGRIEPGQTLSVVLSEPGTVHWGTNGWQDVRDTPTGAVGLGLHVVELPTDRLARGETVDLTYRSARSGDWAGRDWRVTVVPRRARRAKGGSPGRVSKRRPPVTARGQE